MPQAEDEFESPFAHVPELGDGPAPFEPGPLTIEQRMEQVGRVPLRRVGWRWAVAFAVLVLGFVVVAVVVELLGG